MQISKNYRSFPDRAENIRELSRFLLQKTSFFFLLLITFRVDESQPISTLLGLFAADLDPHGEILPAERFIRFDIVGPPQNQTN